MLFKLGELFGIGVDKVLDSARNVIDEIVTNKEEKLEHEYKIEELNFRRETLDKEELENQRQYHISLIKEEVEDRKSARETEQVALKTDDRFVRRFRYYFAIAITFCCFLIISGILIILILEEKQHFADTILGFIMGTALSTIINYFFGTSYTSQVKETLTKKDE